MSKPFRGTYTVLITPFTEDGSAVDFAALADLVDWQIKEGIHGLIPLGSTGIGKGVAVPHTKHPSVEKLVATVALVKEGVDFASLDGEPVYILFLLVSPPDRPGDHLRALENISRHLRNDSFCKFLRQAASSAAVIDLLEEADNNQLH